MISFISDGKSHILNTLYCTFSANKNKSNKLKKEETGTGQLSMENIDLCFKTMIPCHLKVSRMNLTIKKSRAKCISEILIPSIGNFIIGVGLGLGMLTETSAGSSNWMWESYFLGSETPLDTIKIETPNIVLYFSNQIF